MIRPRNRLIFWTAIVALPFSILPAADPTFLGMSLGFIGALFLVVVVDAFRSRSRLNGLLVTAPEVTRMAVARDASIELKVFNPDQTRRTLRLGLDLPEVFSRPFDQMDVTLPAGAEWSVFPWACHPRRRGNFPLPAPEIEVSSPWGFWTCRQSQSASGTARVYPDLTAERRTLALLARSSNGIHAQRQVGKGREFEKLRDYVPGDGSEDIHWKATARRGHPVTKVFQIERTQEVYVAIDASRLSARADAIETQLSAALLLGLAAEQQGDHFGLIAFSDRIETFVRARNGKSHYNACRDAIHALQPRPVNPDFDELSSFLRIRLRRRALVIILTALDDPVLAENFLRNIDLVAGQHLLLVNMIRPAGIAPLFSTDDVTTPDDLPALLGGHLRWHNLEEVARTLARRGVHFSLLDAAELAGQLVSEYLTVKRRQIL